MKSNLIYVIFAILCLSCNQKNNRGVSEEKNNNGTDKFICTENIFSDFIVLSSSLDKYQKPYTSAYFFKGKLKNNTENIYKKVSIRGELILVLENGNELNCSDINITKSLLGDGIISDYRSNWKPNEEWEIKELKSCNFSIEYFDYPVKEVFTQYYLQLADQINNTETEIMISQRDVTDKWKIAQKKIQNNSVDCDDDIWKVSKFLKHKNK